MQWRTTQKISKGTVIIHVVSLFDFLACNRDNNYYYVWFVWDVLKPGCCATGLSDGFSCDARRQVCVLMLISDIEGYICIVNEWLELPFSLVVLQ